MKNVELDIKIKNLSELDRFTDRDLLQAGKIIVRGESYGIHWTEPDSEGRESVSVFKEPDGSFTKTLTSVFNSISDYSLGYLNPRSHGGVETADVEAALKGHIHRLTNPNYVREINTYLINLRDQDDSTQSSEQSNQLFNEFKNQTLTKFGKEQVSINRKGWFEKIDVEQWPKSSEKEIDDMCENANTYDYSLPQKVSKFTHVGPDLLLMHGAEYLKVAPPKFNYVNGAEVKDVAVSDFINKEVEVDLTLCQDFKEKSGKGKKMQLAEMLKGLEGDIFLARNCSLARHVMLRFDKQQGEWMVEYGTQAPEILTESAFQGSYFTNATLHLILLSAEKLQQLADLIVKCREGNKYWPDDEI